MKTKLRINFLIIQDIQWKMTATSKVAETDKIFIIKRLERNTFPITWWTFNVPEDIFIFATDPSFVSLSEMIASSRVKTLIFGQLFCSAREKSSCNEYQYHLQTSRLGITSVTLLPTR